MPSQGFGVLDAAGFPCPLLACTNKNRAPKNIFVAGKITNKKRHSGSQEHMKRPVYIRSTELILVPVGTRFISFNDG